jgi:hypothetical protein
MELFTTMLISSQVRGELRVFSSPGCPPLTYYLYADDVVLFGRASKIESEQIENIIEVFGRFS